MKIRNSLFLLIILLSTSNSKLYATVQASDSLRIEQYLKHIYSLEHIIRNTDNSRFFVEISDEFCYSTLAIDANNNVAQKYLHKNDLIKSTCAQNVNYQVHHYSYLSGIPQWMGFADDPIEYAYDHAFSQLLDSKYFQLYNGALGNTNLTSIIINDNCSEEMFEIGIQTLITNSNHYILPDHILADVIDSDEAADLLNGNLRQKYLTSICSKLNLDKLGVFRMRDLDVINEEIWLVESSFQLFDLNTGLKDAVTYKGFSLDRRGVSLLEILINTLLAVFVLALISYVSLRFSKSKATRLVSKNELFKLFLDQIRFILKCFPLPILISLILVFSLAPLAPSGPEHYLEFNSKLWLTLLITSISVIPLCLNLFLVNRLKLDGFHTISGYRLFAVSSIYSGNLIFNLFTYVNTGNFDYLTQGIYLLNAIIIGDLLARSYFQFSSVNSKSLTSRIGILGIFLSVVFLIFVNGLLITSYSTSIAALGLIIFTLTSGLFLVYVKNLNSIGTRSSTSPELGKSSIKIPFVHSLIDPNRAIFEAIRDKASDVELNVMLISGSAGIGKTRSILEAKNAFINSGWDWYYGDCDEIQNDSSPSFEPFLEAFKNLLHIDVFADRGKQLDNVVGSALEAGATLLPADPTSFIKPYDRSSTERMTETCIEIIDTLEKKGKDFIFVMEDLHWIDPESYELFKLFIQVINRNKFARSKATILLTIRESDFITYRGPNIYGLKTDLEKLQKNTSHKFRVYNILNDDNFKVLDFLLFINNTQNELKLQSSTLIQINEIFNKSINQIKITPKYIITTVENWIIDGTLVASYDGYKLAKQINVESLPRETDADVYYHNIISKYDAKWGRLLESAAIIGNKFDALILARVWNYDILDVLDFLEQAVKDRLVIDVSSEDNIFHFGEKDKTGSDKRIVNAIKSFYNSTESVDSEKQIVIEYNKRFIRLHEESLTDLSNLSTEELLVFLKRLGTLLSNSEYHKRAEIVIFEVVTRLVYQDLTEKLGSIVSLLKSFSELSDACEVIQLIITRSSNDATHLAFSDRIASHSTSSSLVYNLTLLTKLIAKGEERTNQNISLEDITHVEDQLVNIHSANVGVFLATLLVDVKFKESDFSLKTQYIKNYYETLKPDFIGEHIYLYSVMRIRYTQSRITPEGKEKLDSDSFQLYQSVKTSPSLEFLKVRSFNLRLEILSYVLENDDQAISEFLNAAEEDFRKKDYNWTQVVLNFLNSYCADIYFKRYSQEAKVLLSECEIIIYKYHDDEVWNLLIYQLLTAKSTFELSQGNVDLALQYSEKNSELMRSNHKMNLPSYRENCTKTAKIYEAMGEGQKSIDKKLESIELLKQKIARSKAPDDLDKKELSIDYNNISHVYRNHLNDYKNALKYAKLSLELKTPDEEKSFGISLYSVGRAYDAMQDFDNALEYYQKAKEYFIGELPREIYQRNILDLNISLAMVQLGSPNSLISLVNAVKSLETDQMKEYLTNPIKERLRFAKSFIKN